MEAKDTVATTGELCLMVCLEHREATLESKNCGGLDCDVCQLTKQAEISFKAGIREVVGWIEDWAFWDNLSDDIHTEWQAKLKEWGVTDA